VGHPSGNTKRRKPLIEADEAAVTAADVVLATIAEARCSLSLRLASLVSDMVKCLRKHPKHLADGVYAATLLVNVLQLPYLRQQDFTALFVETVSSRPQQVDVSQLQDMDEFVAFDGTDIVRQCCRRARTLVHYNTLR